MKTEHKAFVGVDHGTDQISFGIPVAAEVRPISIHHKSEGTIDDKPSFAILMRHSHGGHSYGQISLEMLNDGLSDIGYKIIKK